MISQIAYKVVDKIDESNELRKYLGKLIEPSLVCTKCGKKFNHLTIIDCSIPAPVLKFGAFGNTKHPAYCDECCKEWKNWEELANLNAKLREVI